MSIRAIRSYKVIFPALITLILLGVLLITPGLVSGVTATLDTTDTVGTPTTTFKLGQPIKFNAVIDLAAGEPVPATVLLDVAGDPADPELPSFLSPVAINVAPGTQDLTAQVLTKLPPLGAFDLGNVFLECTVDFKDTVTTPGGGYGFGYGGSAGGKLLIMCTYIPPVLKFPLPVVLPTLPGTANLFNITGGTAGPGGGEGGGGGPPDFPQFGFTGDIFGVPESPFEAKARALGVPDLGEVDVIMDGFPGSNDVLARLGVGAGFLFVENSLTMPPVDIGSAAASMDEVQALTDVNPSTVVVAGGTSGADAFVAKLSVNLGVFPATASVTASKFLTDDGTASGTPLFTNRPGAAAYDGTNIFISDFEPDPSKSVTVLKLNASTLAFVSSFTVPLGPVGQPGFDGLAFNPLTGTFMGSAHGSENVIVEFDGTGVVVGTPKVPEDESGGDVTDPVTGLGIVVDGKGTGDTSDDESLLFAVTRDLRDIWASTLLGPGAVIGTGEFSNIPTFVARDPDSGNFFVGVEGDPGVIRVFDPAGSPVGGQDPLTPNISGSPIGIGDIAGGVLVPAGGGPELWIVDNESSIVLRRLDPATGAELASLTLPGFVGDLGGLAFDGTDFWGYERFSDTLHRISKTDGAVLGTFFVFDEDFSDPFFPPGGAEGLTIVDVSGKGTKLVAARFNQALVISLGGAGNPPTGAIEGGFELGFDVEGRGLDAGSLIIADAGFGAGEIIQGAFPGEALVETTVIGDYKATLDTTPSSPTNPATDFEVDFTLEKGDLSVSIVAPTDGSGLSLADLDVNDEIPVTGTVGDFTIDTVSFGAELGVTTLVGFPTAAPTGPLTLDTAAEQTAAGADWPQSGLWHVSTGTGPGGKKYNGAAGFYYGQEPAFDFDTGPTTNSGNLDSPTFTVGDGTELSFVTWYDTEPGFDWDQKLIQFCTSGASCTTVAQIVDFFPPFLGFAEPGTVYDPSQVGANFPPFNDGRKFVFVPSEFFGPGGPELASVTLLLKKALGTGFVRFRFDTVDSFGNEGEGWYADEIQVTGAGPAEGVTFPVVNGAWSGKFAPSDGKNVITVNVSRTAYDPGTASDSVTVFLDTLAPLVSFDTPSLSSKTFSPATAFVTKDTFLTVKGRFTELTPDILEIFKLFDTDLATLQSKDVFTDPAKKLISTVKSFDSTNLAAAVDAGDTDIDVDDSSDFAVGDLLQIDSGDEAEVRTVTAITGSTMTLDSALTMDHDEGTTVADVGFSKDANLGTTDGFVKLGVKLTDKGGQAGTDELLLLLDTAGPVVKVLPPIFPVGATSARPGDPIIFQVTASDVGSGVDKVQFLQPGSSPVDFLPSSAIPDLVRGSLGIVGTHVLFTTVPDGTPPGTFSISLSATDLAGNTDTDTAEGDIVASLEAMNYPLGSGASLIGVNLQPDEPAWAEILDQPIDPADLDSTFVAGLGLASSTLRAGASIGDSTITVADATGFAVGDWVKIGAASEVRQISAVDTGTGIITLTATLAAAHSAADPVAQQATMQDIVDTIFSFTGGTATTGSFLVNDGPGGAADTLTDGAQGLGYWLFTKPEAYKTSTPLPGFTTGTPIPVRMVLSGVLFDATATPPSLPATVDVVKAWNIIALISERDRTVEQGVRGLLFPTRTFTSLVEFQKFVEFDPTTGETTVVGGVFHPLFTGTGLEDMKITRGFYVFMGEDDTHVP